MSRFPNFLFIFLFFMTAQLFFSQNFYQKQWTQIKKNSEKGQYKSNLPLILTIKNQAVKDQNLPELLKALKVEFQILKNTQDDENNDEINRFFLSLESLDFQNNKENKVVFSLLKVLFLSDYYDQNQWKINPRTSLLSPKGAAIETYTKLDFSTKIAALFSAIDLEKEVLFKVPLQPYQSIFNDTSTIHFFPTFLDWYTLKKCEFLQNRQFFTPNEIANHQPEIKSWIQDRIDKNEGNPKLYFLHEKLKLDYKNQEKKYQEGLLALVNSSIEGDYKVLLVDEIMENLIQKEQPKEALEWAKTMAKIYPKSTFLTNINQKKEQILQPFLQSSVQESNLPQEPILLSVTHKNTKHFSLKIYQINENFQGFLQYISAPYQYPISTVQKHLVRTQAFTLPTSSDYKKHLTSLELLPLPAGLYFAEIVSDFYNKNEDVYTSFHFVVSSQRAMPYLLDDKENAIYQWVSAKNGAPSSSKQLQVFSFKRNNEIEKTKVVVEQNGTFKLQSAKENFSQFLIHDAQTNNFQLINVQFPYIYNENSESLKTQIFTDRAIYRPGQLVYYKAIVTQKKGKKVVVLPNQKQEIILLGAHGEELAKQTHLTNEIGSYHGSFLLPKNQLNGSFSLVEKTGNGYKPINVEEYKRPKFQVTFDPITSEYQYGQKLIITGKAMSYSGVPASAVPVKLTLKKQNIRWRYFPWYPHDESNENTILGETTTNNTGAFSIEVLLEKNPLLKGIQIDEYLINAMVTDISGETQTANTHIKVASVSHYITAEKPTNTTTDQPIKVSVITKNYNDQKIAKPISYQLYKNQTKPKLYRSAFAQEVQDLPGMSKKDFERKFPLDFYDKEEVLLSKKMNIVDSKHFSKEQMEQSNLIALGKLSAGDYRLEMYSIEKEDTIKSSIAFQVWDKEKLDVLQKPFFETYTEKKQYKKGAVVPIYLYSAVPNALVNIKIQTGDGITKTEERKLNNGFLKYAYTIPQGELRAHPQIQFQLVGYSEVHLKTEIIELEPEPAALSIETTTFRDKLLPNSKEEWTLKIVGNGKNKVDAEVLATMYDASLDAFTPHTLQFDNLHYQQVYIWDYNSSNDLIRKFLHKRLPYLESKRVEIPSFSWMGNDYEGVSVRAYANTAAPMALEGKVSGVMIRGAKGITKSRSSEVLADKSEGEEKQDLSTISVRKNLNETAFFYPELRTDKDGNVHYSFTTPEALTEWKLLFLAHNKEAQFASLEKKVITQKEFSISPNYPRFLREGDQMKFSSKMANLSGQPLEGVVAIEIIDASSMQDVTKDWLTQSSQQHFSLSQNENKAVSWSLKTPNNATTVIIKVVGKAGKFSDGEQQSLAVLPNRTLVTEAVPVFVKEGENKTFSIEKEPSATRKSFAYTLELTTNPIWEVLLALPSLKNDLNTSADVAFNKYFADVLATEILKAHPKLKTIFQNIQDKNELISNLEKNQELKQVLLQETPWLLESKDEKEQMQKLALLFDANTMGNTISRDWKDIISFQNTDGGFSWQKGNSSSLSTSMFILKNWGKLNLWLKKNASTYPAFSSEKELQDLVRYIDKEVQNHSNDLDQWNWNTLILEYLDSRHFWENKIPLPKHGLLLKNKAIERAKNASFKEFSFFGLHRMALLMHSYNQKEIAKRYLTYLKETATQSKKQGVYWKQNQNNWGWNGSAIVNHAGALEAFSVIQPEDEKTIEELKIWLVTQKEVGHWDTSRATAEVIFIMLNSGKDWTSAASDKVNIEWGKRELQDAAQATGYIKISESANGESENQYQTVKVEKKGPGIVQGGLYWQYFEDLNKISSSENYLSIQKEYFIKKQSSNGEILEKIMPDTPVKVGDLITVRMVLNSDRNMEFIHLKDTRPAGVEPVDVLSGYQWKNGLGYYQSTLDTATHFYIEYLNKGKYIFEYEIRANAAGVFSNGITTLQNYYAPQMNAHSSGSTLQILE